MSTTMIKPAMSVKEVAELFGVTENAVYKWIDTGKLKPEAVVRFGRRIRIKGEALERLLRVEGGG